MIKIPFLRAHREVLTATAIWVAVLALAAVTDSLLAKESTTVVTVQNMAIPTAALAADDEMLRAESLELAEQRTRSRTKTAMTATGRAYGAYTGTGRALVATRSGGNFNAEAYNGYTGAYNLPQYQAANSDVKAWLRIPGTNIDYPILQSQKSDHYYESLNAYGQSSKAGCLWTSMLTVFGNSSQISSNTVIYGHNWNNCRLGEPRTYTPGMQMFEGLMSYHYLSWAQAYPYLYYSTLQEQMTYVIFACCYTSNSDWYIMAQPDMSQMIYTAQAYSLFRFDVDVNSTDKVITLSTCTRTHGYSEDQRFIVMARLLRPGEEMEPISVSSNY